MPEEEHETVDAALRKIEFIDSEVEPGPMRAFYQRIRARPGHHVAVTPVARKLGCLCWCLLTWEEDYAYARTPR